MNTLAFAIEAALEKKRDDWDAKHRAYRQRSKPKPMYPGTKANLTAVDPSGKELTGRIFAFYGVNVSEHVLPGILVLLEQGASAPVMKDGMVVGKLKLEKDRWNVPVARMYRLAA